MNIAKYFINFPKYVPNFVPRILRGTKLLAYLNVGTRPLVTLNSEFVGYVTETSEFLIHNSQVIYFEKRLNDLFDPVLRGISITFGITGTQQYFFKKSELEEDPTLFLKAEFQYETHLYKESEVLSESSFTINVPAYVSETDNRIRRISQLYTTSGKQFTILRY
jgi:hypothetical protein